MGKLVPSTIHWKKEFSAEKFAQEQKASFESRGWKVEIKKHMAKQTRPDIFYLKDKPLHEENDETWQKLQKRLIPEEEGFKKLRDYGSITDEEGKYVYSGDYGVPLKEIAMRMIEVHNSTVGNNKWKLKKILHSPKIEERIIIVEESNEKVSWDLKK